MILLHKQQNVVDIDVHLPDQFQLEHDIVVDILLLRISRARHLAMNVQVHALVILQIARWQERIILLEIIKRRENVPEAQNAAEDAHEILLRLLAQDRLTDSELLAQLQDKLRIALVVTAARIVIAVVVVAETSQQHDALGILITEKRDRIVRRFRQIAKSDDIAKRLDRIQNAVRA